MTRSSLLYWTLVVAAGIFTGVFVEQLVKKNAVTDKAKSRNSLTLQKLVSEAIQCSKKMDNTHGYSLPRRPHN